MANTRKDSKGRGLHVGEQQRKDGVYLYRYTDVTGKRQTVYAGDLPELRAKEKQIQKDLDDNACFAGFFLIISSSTAISKVGHIIVCINLIVLCVYPAFDNFL